MRLFNKLLVLLLAIAVLAGAISVIVLAWSSPESSIDALRDGVDWLDDNNEDLQKVILTSVGALIALAAFTLILLELMPSSGPDVKVTDVKVGDAVLSTTAIGQRVEEALKDLPHVSEARALVTPKRKGVLVSLQLQVDPQANLAAVADEAAQAASDVLANKVHVALVEPPLVRLHYRELRLQRSAQPARPAPAPAPAAAPPPAERPDEPAAEVTDESAPSETRSTTV